MEQPVVSGQETIVSRWEIKEPFIDHIDSRAEWWHLMMVLCASAFNLPTVCRVHEKRLMVVNTKKMSFAPDVSATFSDQLLTYLNVDLTHAQLDLIKNTDRNILIIATESTNDVIVDPCVRFSEVPGMRHWANTIGKQVALDILRLLCRIDYRYTTRDQTEKYCITATLLPDYIDITGFAGERQFQLLCGRKDCPTSLTNDPVSLMSIDAE